MRTFAAIKELRHAIVEAIADANIENIGDNVYEARRESVWPEEGMLAVVYTDSFSLDDQRTSPKDYKVTGTVYVDVICQSEGDSVNDDLDDATSAIIEALQPMMPREGFFGGLTKRFVVTGIENNLSESGEMNRGLQRITFLTEFHVTVPVGGPTDDFLKAKSTIKMGKGIGNKQEFTTVVRVLPERPDTQENNESVEHGETDA